MFCVVDVNVIISSLLGKGDSFNTFALNSIFGKFEFVAPEFLSIELEKHKDEIRERTKLTDEEFNDVLEFVMKQVTFIPKTQFSDCLPEAKTLLAENLKDTPYLALALKLDCNMFSGDKSLKAALAAKQCRVNVLPPKEMLDKL